MNWMAYKKIYFALSGVLTIVSILSLLFWGLRMGVDFTGGSVIEYRFKNEVTEKELMESFEGSDIDISLIQKTQDSYIFKFPPLDMMSREAIQNSLSDMFGSESIEELRFETVGPIIGSELIKKTAVAVTISSVAILLWIAIQFRSFKFGLSAVIAMFHDTFNLVGVYSLLGHFSGAEVDFLFVTAILITLSFSVHDTIVVYDRIREMQKKYREDIKILADRAITETMVRSLNNSFTIIFMLLALILLGGATVRWFAVALLVGTVLGTYSSPFVAVPLLVSWEEIVGRIRNQKR